MADESDDLMLPLSLCRDVRILGGTPLSLKALLCMEAWREPGETVVTMPVARLAADMGCRHESVRRGVERLADMTVLVPDGDDWTTWGVADAREITIGRGEEAEVSVRLSPLWQRASNAEREVALPLGDVRALETRCGLLLRLRAAAALHGRKAKTDPRLRFSTRDFPHYTGYDGAGSPSTILRQLLKPGLEDLQRNSSTIEVSASTAHRDGEKVQSWLRHVEWRITPLRRREVTSAA